MNASRIKIVKDDINKYINIPINMDWDFMGRDDSISEYEVDAIKKVKGVGNVIIFGERKYAMRIWLDPNRLSARGLTAQDVVSAIQQQNLQHR